MYFTQIYKHTKKNNSHNFCRLLNNIKNYFEKDKKMIFNEKKIKFKNYQKKYAIKKKWSKRIRRLTSLQKLGFRRKKLVFFKVKRWGTKRIIFSKNIINRKTKTRSMEGAILRNFKFWWPSLLKRYRIPVKPKTKMKFRKPLKIASFCHSWPRTTSVFKTYSININFNFCIWIKKIKKRSYHKWWLGRRWKKWGALDNHRKNKWLRKRDQYWPHSGTRFKDHISWKTLSYTSPKASRHHLREAHWGFDRVRFFQLKMENFKDSSFSSIFENSTSCPSQNKGSSASNMSRKLIFYKNSKPNFSNYQTITFNNHFYYFSTFQKNYFYKIKNNYKNKIFENFSSLFWNYSRDENKQKFVIYPHWGRRKNRILRNRQILKLVPKVLLDVEEEELNKNKKTKQKTRRHVFPHIPKFLIRKVLILDKDVSPFQKKKTFMQYTKRKRVRPGTNPKVTPFRVAKPHFFNSYRRHQHQKIKSWERLWSEAIKHKQEIKSYNGLTIKFQKINEKTNVVKQFKRWRFSKYNRKTFDKDLTYNKSKTWPFPKYSIKSKSYQPYSFIKKFVKTLTPPIKKKRKRLRLHYRRSQRHSGSRPTKLYGLRTWPRGPFTIILNFFSSKVPNKKKIRILRKIKTRNKKKMKIEQVLNIQSKNKNNYFYKNKKSNKLPYVNGSYYYNFMKKEFNTDILTYFNIKKKNSKQKKIFFSNKSFFKFGWLLSIWAKWKPIFRKKRRRTKRLRRQLIFGRPVVVCNYGHTNELI